MWWGTAYTDTTTIGVRVGVSEWMDGWMDGWTILLYRAYLSILHTPSL